MPYKEREKRLKAQKEAMAKKRQGSPKYVNPSVNPSVNLSEPSVDDKIAELRQVIGKIAQSPVVVEKKVQLPIYNAMIHKAGDRVRVWLYGRWEEVVVPEVDIEGTPFEGYTRGLLVCNPNYSVPQFSPALKVITGRKVGHNR